MGELLLYINGKEISAKKGESILAAAVGAGFEIPTLCHDDRVSAYGSCGICVVEEEGKPRLLRACATAAEEGMRLLLDSERVIKTRKTVLELLLSDHSGDCRPPCLLACPANTDCQGYVGLIANGEYEAAAELIRTKIPFPASIGRVCPHPCETACRRNLMEEPVSIAQLKYFAADKVPAKRPELPEESGKSVGIIGGGPGGLSAAYFLRLMGHAVTVYDQNTEMGGMLRYGIPEYRLPRQILADEIKFIEDMGVSMVANARIGGNMSLDEVRSSHDAVIIAIGAWNSAKLNIPGDGLPGVVGGIEYLREAAYGRAESAKGKKIAVVGGGNTAMDAARTAIRLGASCVYNIYRRTKDEMPALPIEITEAEEEGVIFSYLVSPVEITEADGMLSVRLQKMRLGEADASGRRAPVPIPGDLEILSVDMVITAIGQAVNMRGFEGAGLDISKRGTFLADERTFSTTQEGVFAIGDAVNRGPHIAVSAIAMAERSAFSISSWFKGERPEYREPILVKQEPTDADFADREKIKREIMPHISPEIRKNSFKEVNLGYPDEAARKEASRCLECGCADYFECKLLAYSREYGANPDKYQGGKHKGPAHKDVHPNIARNEEKCILCGVCARICEEGVKAGVLGLVGRGFDTMVLPAFGEALEAAGCLGCGNCVSACPVGALTERSPMRKTVPVKEVLTETYCPGCEVKCAVIAGSVGGTLLRVMPNNPEGLLCAKGKFYYTDGEFAETPGVWEFVTAKMDEIHEKYGAGAVCVAVSPSLSDEELEKYRKMAEKYEAVLATFAKKDLPPVSLEYMIKNPEQGRERGGNESGLRALKGLVYLDSAEPVGRGIKLLLAVGETPEINTDGLLFTSVTSYRARKADVVLPLRNPMLTRLSP